MPDPNPAYPIADLVDQWTEAAKRPIDPDPPDEKYYSVGPVRVGATGDPGISATTSIGPVDLHGVFDLSGLNLTGVLHGDFDGTGGHVGTPGSAHPGTAEPPEFAGIWPPSVPAIPGDYPLPGHDRQPLLDDLNRAIDRLPVVPDHPLQLQLPGILGDHTAQNDHGALGDFQLHGISGSTFDGLSDHGSDHDFAAASHQTSPAGAELSDHSAAVSIDHTPPVGSESHPESGSDGAAGTAAGHP